MRSMVDEFSIDIRLCLYYGDHDFQLFDDILNLSFEKTFSTQLPGGYF